MALGPTHWSWRPDVAAIVRAIESKFPGTTQNTYVAHPWPGWDGRSIDIWGPGGRGDAIEPRTGHNVLAYLRSLPGAPYIRHHIYLHSLWTSFGGYSWWSADDHSGSLRHVHVTYW